MENLQKIDNQHFLQELRERLINKKISEKQLGEIVREIHKLAKEKELEKAYSEWANDQNEWKDIKEKY